MGDKTAWSLVVRLRHWPAITRNGYLRPPACLPADVWSFAILGIPGLLCRSEQSSALVCSFTGPARSGTLRHVPARSRHTLDTRLGLPRRTWHSLPVYLAPAGILRGCPCRYRLLRLSRGKPVAVTDINRTPGIVMPDWVCRFSYVG